METHTAVYKGNVKAAELVKVRRAAQARAWEDNRCAPDPHGCGQRISPLVIVDASNLMVLLQTEANDQGPMTEAMAFRDEQSLREYQVTALCQKCQDVFYDKHLEDETTTPVDGGLMEMTEEEVRNDG